MRRVGLISLVLFLVTFGVFSRVLVANFVEWDDNISVYQNPHIQGLDWGRVRWMFTDASYAMRYKPLTWLAYALIYQAGGLNPFGYHLANLLLHCFNVVLVFLVIRRLLTAGTPTRGPDKEWAQATLPAAVGALLWALNPLRVEPVARVTDLTFCLQLFFLLVSLWCYLRACDNAALGARTVPGSRSASAERSPPPKLGPLYWCSVVGFALAMLAYPFALGYGVVLLLLDWYPLRRFEGCSHWWRDARARRILLEKVPFLLLGATMLPTIFARLNPTGVWVAFRMDSHLTWFGQAMQAFYVWAYYLWKPWWPFHLSPLYTTLVDFNPNTWPFWLSAALVIGATVALVLGRKRRPWAPALWLSYLVLLVPVLGLTEHPHYTADRYDYLPGLVWAVAVAVALKRVGSGRFGNIQHPLRRRDSAASPTSNIQHPRGFSLPIIGCWMFPLALAMFWGGLSVRQTGVWRNSKELFEYMISQLKDDPNRSDIQWRLGSILASQGEVAEAARQYEASLALEPTAAAHLCFAELLERNGDPQGALTNCQAALALGPSPPNRVQAGQVLAALGRSAEAIAQYRKALADAPDLVPALNNLAWILASAPAAADRNGPEAVRLAERARVLTDNQVPVVIGTLAAAYAESGRFKEAIAAAQQARDLAQAMGERDIAEKNSELLELYRAGKPYHESPGKETTEGHR